MDRWNGKVAVVTGASQGIGASIAKNLALSGMQVVGLARNLERLNEVGVDISSTKGKFFAIKCDVTKEDEIVKAFAWIKEHLGGVDVLINNAGLCKKSFITVPDNSEVLRSTLDTNVWGVTICTREAVLSMKERNVAGHIINMNGITGHGVKFSPNPVANLNPATKHAMTALTEVLRQELIYFKTKIKVSSISPGAVDTEIWETEKYPRLLKYKETHDFLTVEDISQAVLYVLGTPPHVQVQELIIRPIGEEI